MVSKLFREAKRASPGPAGPRGEARLGRQWQDGERAEMLSQEHGLSGKARTAAPGRGLTAATAELAPRQNHCRDPQEPASGTVPDSCLKTHQPNGQRSAHTGFGTADCGHNANRSHADSIPLGRGQHQELSTEPFLPDQSQACSAYTPVPVSASPPPAPPGSPPAFQMGQGLGHHRTFALAELCLQRPPRDDGYTHRPMEASSSSSTPPCWPGRQLAGTARGAWRARQGPRTAPEELVSWEKGASLVAKQGLEGSGASRPSHL